MVLYGFEFADYSCESIERKVTDLLHAAGVRADVRVAAEGCLPRSGLELDTIIRVKMQFHALLPPPEKSVAAEDEPEEDDEAARKREEEAAELRRRSFPADRVETRLVWQSAYPIERADCALLQHFRERVMVHIPHQQIGAADCDPAAPAGPRMKILAPSR